MQIRMSEGSQPFNPKSRARRRAENVPKSDDDDDDDDDGMKNVVVDAGAGADEKNRNRWFAGDGEKSGFTDGPLV